VSLRCVRSTWSAILGLSLALVLLSIAGGASSWALLALTDPASSSAAVTATAPTTPSLVLLSQSPSWIGPSQPSLSLNLGVSPSAGSAASLTVALTFYGRVVTRSAFTQALGGSPSQGVLLHTSPAALADGGTRASFCTNVSPDDNDGSAPAGSTCPSGAPLLDLDCTAGSGSCDGVYPVVVSLERDGTALAHLTTFLTYDEPNASSVPKPLRVALVLPLQLPTTFTPSADGSVALQSPSKSEATSIDRVVTTVAAQPTVATTILASGQTVQALEKAGGKAGRSAVNQLSALSQQATGSTGDQVPAQGYVPFSASELVASGLSGEVNNQMARGHALAATNRIVTTDGTWVESDSVGSGLTEGLHAVDANQLVLPDSDLASVNASNLTESQPFQLDLTKNQHVNAVASDSLLSSHFVADPGNPVLAANQLLADLSFIHYENPYEDDARGEVALPPSSWTPNAPMVDAIVKGLTANPVLAPVTVNQLFAQVPAGGNNQPAQRHLATSGTGPRFTSAFAGQIALGRTHLAGFDSAVQGHPPVLTQLGDLLLAAQASTLTGLGRLSGVNSFNQVLSGQLALIQLAIEHTITFTARTAPIPITIISKSGYTVAGHLIVASNSFTFPQGAVRPMVLERQINSVSIQAHSRTSGDHLPVVVTFRSPNGDLIIARGTVIVQSTSISLVGIVLTILAAVVLLTWWIRTYLQRRRGRPPRRGHAGSP
jgi:hypothetical protein